MLVSLATGAFVVGLLVLFFSRSLRMDIGEAIFAALFSAGLLGALIASAIYLGRLF
jgi:VanZ family protein